MKYQSILNKFFMILALILFLSLPGAGLARQTENPVVAFPTVITYQGYLESNNQPVNKTCTIDFSLWDAQSGGHTVGPALEDKYDVVDGRFTAELDFGNVFDGTVLWLQIAVNCEGDADFTELPRQLLTSSPYALNSDKVDNRDASYFATAGHTHAHSALTGLLNDDHPQYFNLSQNETAPGNNTFSGINTFSGSNTFTKAGAPFFVNSQVIVANLDADFLDGQHASYFQARVSGACALGSTIKSIDASGNVVCEPHETRPIYSAGTLDSNTGSGVQSAITIGSDGLPVIAYYIRDLSSLYVAHCNNLACTSPSFSLVEDTGGSDAYPAITIGANGFPIISYYFWGIAGANKDLRLAICGDLACSSSTKTPLVNAGDVGLNSAIVIDNLGNPVISYVNATTASLEYVKCSTSDCSGWSSSPLDIGNVSMDTSITIGGDGAPLISYKKNNNLWVYHCNITTIGGGNYDCLHGFTQTALDAYDSVAYFNSITTGTDGLGVISYSTGPTHSLKVAHCSNFLCNAANLVTIDGEVSSSGQYNSIAIGSDGLPVISYSHYTGDNLIRYLRVAHCSDPLCNAFTIANVDETTGTKGETSIAIGMDGMPVISYYNENDTLLKFAHCSNVFCMRWFRRK